MIDWDKVRADLDAIEWKKVPFEDREDRMVRIGPVNDIVPSAGEFPPGWYDTDSKALNEIAAAAETRQLYLTMGQDENDTWSLYVYESRLVKGS